MLLLFSCLGKSLTNSRFPLLSLSLSPGLFPIAHRFVHNRQVCNEFVGMKREARRLRRLTGLFDHPKGDGDEKFLTAEAETEERDAQLWGMPKVPKDQRRDGRN